VNFSVLLFHAKPKLNGLEIPVGYESVPLPFKSKFAKLGKENNNMHMINGILIFNIDIPLIILDG